MQFLAPLPFSLGSIVLMIVSAGWLLSVDLALGLIAVVVIPLISVANIAFVRIADKPAERIQGAVAELSDVVHETVDGIAVVKVLGAGDERRRVIGSRIDGLRRAKLTQLRLQVIFDTALELIPAVLAIVLVLVGAHRARAGAVSVGEVVSVVQLFERLIWPLRMLAFAAAALPRSIAGRARIAEVVDAPLERLPASGPVVDDDDVIELAGVRVVHDDGRVALDGVDLEIRRGSRVAVVGPTGSGKSTLLHVLAGLDAPTAGAVRRAPDAAPVLVFQEPLLFSGSLRHNVVLGAPLGPEEVDRALDAASGSGFVGALSEGLGTTVGERGVTLSGGQRQRIALARALARRPRVLLLDDTTSALDPTTEAEVLAALRDRALAETVVMVAARPSGIALADEIVLLDAGRVADRGRHEELLARSELYRSIVSAYSVGDEDLPTVDEVGAGHGADEEERERVGVVATLRRASHLVPAFWSGIWITVLLAAVGAFGRLILPLLVQRSINDGFDTDSTGPLAERVDTSLILRYCAIALAATVVTQLATRVAAYRLGSWSEWLMASMRRRCIDRFLDISLDQHASQKKGVLVARVTTDVESIARFFEWGAISWLINSLIVVIISVYLVVTDLRLGLLAIVVASPVVFAMQFLQKRLLVAYGEVRRHVGTYLGRTGELVSGAAVIRAYRAEEVMRSGAEEAIEDRRRSQVRTGVLGALLFPMGELFATLAVTGVVLAAIGSAPRAASPTAPSSPSCSRSSGCSTRSPRSPRTSTRPSSPWPGCPGCSTSSTCPSSWRHRRPRCAPPPVRSRCGSRASGTPIRSGPRGRWKTSRSRSARTTAQRPPPTPTTCPTSHPCRRARTAGRCRA